MSDRFPILRSLDPYHARIGYLGALASVGIRGLDRQDALAARFHDLLFDRVFADDQRYSGLVARVPQDRRPELDKRYLRPEEEDPTAVFTEPAPTAIEEPPADWLLSRTSKRPRPKLVRTEWLYVSELWLYDERMPSPVGFVPREKLDRTIDLARWTGVLLPTLELSETGYLLQHLLATARRSDPAGELFNPLCPTAHPALPLLYFRILLASELLYPFLVLELVDRHGSGKILATRGKDGLLLAATDRLLETIGEISDPEDALGVRDVMLFRDSIAAKDSTQENYLRPRLEMLVDLGFLGRRATTSKFMWDPSTATGALARVLSPFTVSTKNVSEVLSTFLDRHYFQAASAILSPGLRRIVDDRERMRWLGLAFEEIGREFGFTPGRTLALKACLLAWQGGSLMEVGEVFDSVYRMAGDPEVAQFLHFSGGSRFDREFLIRIDEGLLKTVATVQGKGGSVR